MDWRNADENEGGKPGRLLLSWPALFLAGWLLYEFTAQPGLAALVACAKFGWGDLRTAFWLRRVDPDRRRGRTCFWCYLTYGLWKVAILATVATIMIGFLGEIVKRIWWQPAANIDISPVLAGAVTAAGLGLGLSIPTAYAASWSASRNGVRVWLGHAPERARKERFWPPRHGRINAAPFVGFTTTVLTVILIVFLDSALFAFWNALGVWGIVLSFLVKILAVPVAMFLLSLSDGRVAQSPQECWTAEENEEVYQAPTAEERMNEA